MYNIIMHVVYGITLRNRPSWTLYFQPMGGAAHYRYRELREVERRKVGYWCLYSVSKRLSYH
jgi:hypothetical protein